jgi:hypothetical protein
MESNHLIFNRLIEGICIIPSAFIEALDSHITVAALNNGYFIYTILYSFIIILIKFNIIIKILLIVENECFILSIYDSESKDNKIKCIRWSGNGNTFYSNRGKREGIVEENGVEVLQPHRQLLSQQLVLFLHIPSQLYSLSYLVKELRQLSPAKSLLAHALRYFAATIPG